MKPKFTTKLSLITACKGGVVSTVIALSALRNVQVVIQKLDLDQNINGAYTCWKILI